MVGMGGCSRFCCLYGSPCLQRTTSPSPPCSPCVHSAGSSAEFTTPSRCCTAGEGSSLLTRTWQVPLAFTGLHWVTADTRLAAALVRYPLTITLVKHEPTRSSASSSAASSRAGSRRASAADEEGGSGGRGQQGVVDVPLGTAEVDLSPLLSQRPGPQQPNSRWVNRQFQGGLRAYLIKASLPKYRSHIHRHNIDVSPYLAETCIQTHPDGSCMMPAAAACRHLLRGAQCSRRASAAGHGTT